MTKILPTMKYFYAALTLILCALSIPTFGQSLSGNVAEMSNSNALNYANVEIYQNNKLVASLITDNLGNYNVALDSGSYVVNIMYSGMETKVENIHVTKDEVMNAFLSENEKADGVYREVATEMNESKKLLAPVSKAYVVSDDDLEISYDLSEIVEDKPHYTHSDIVEGSFARSEFVEGDFVPSYTLGSEGKMISDRFAPELDEGHAFALTAGEINDFAKFDLWSDLLEAELAKHQSFWKLKHGARYTVQCLNKEKIPLVDAEVILQNAAKETLWTARTDNTGKAELWSHINLGQENPNAKDLKILVHYRGQTRTLKKVKEINNGLNTVQFEAECDAATAVDIAFVVDATGSMSDEINFLKAEINDVVFQAKQNNSKLSMRFGNVFYRDHGEEYLTRVSPFTNVLTESAAFVNKQTAAGGGDQPEAVEVGLEAALNELEWSEDARARILFLVLDASPHNTLEIREKLKKLSKKAAAKGVKIVPISGSGIEKGTEFLMRTLALSTNGTYVFLTDHSGIGGSHIAPSTDTYEVQMLNDLLVNLLKNYTYVPDCEETVPELIVELPDSLVFFAPPQDSLPLDSLALDSLAQIDIPADSLIADIPPFFDPQDAENISWQFYPNPTYGPLTIEVSKQVEELFLTDLNGKVIRKINMNGNSKINTNLDGLPMGIYMLRYPVGKKWLSGKVVLVR